MTMTIIVPFPPKGVKEPGDDAIFLVVTETFTNTSGKVFSESIH